MERRNPGDREPWPVRPPCCDATARNLVREKPYPMTIMLWDNADTPAEGTAKLRLLLGWVAAGVLVFALSGCDLITSYELHNPATGQSTGCVTWRGTNDPLQIQHLYQCVAGCEARGFILDPDTTLPPPVPYIAEPVPRPLPDECRDPNAPPPPPMTHGR